MTLKTPRLEYGPDIPFELQCLRVGSTLQGEQHAAKDLNPSPDTWLPTGTAAHLANAKGRIVTAGLITMGLH